MLLLAPSVRAQTTTPESPLPSHVAPPAPATTAAAWMAPVSGTLRIRYVSATRKWNFYTNEGHPTLAGRTLQAEVNGTVFAEDLDPTTANPPRFRYQSKHVECVFKWTGNVCARESYFAQELKWRYDTRWRPEGSVIWAGHDPVWELGEVDAGEPLDLRLVYRHADGSEHDLTLTALPSYSLPDGVAWAAEGWYFGGYYPYLGGIEDELRIVVELVGEEPELDRFDVSVDSDVLRHGAIASVFAQALDAEGNAIDLPGSTPVVVELVQGEPLGGLRRSIGSPSSSQLATTYEEIRAGRITSGVLFRADGSNPITLGEDKRQVQIRVRHAETPGKEGIGRLEVVADFHVELSVEPAMVDHGRTAIFRVQAVDEDGVPILDLPDDTPFDFTLTRASVADTTFGTLNGAGQRGATLTAVPYGDARAWAVLLSATGERPEQETTVWINVAHSRMPTITDAVPVVIKPSVWDLVHYIQGSDPWGDDDYDSYVKSIANEGTDQEEIIYHSMGAKGCALTAMAMVLRGAGIDVDPGGLNQWMKENRGFSGPNIKWSTPVRYPGGQDVIRFDVRLMKGAPGNNQPLDLEPLREIIDQNYLAIAQVKNPSTGNRHWVLITGRSADGYTILDPGGYTDRTTLEAYENEVYRYVPYSQSK